jgi:hypothetical protein
LNSLDRAKAFLKGKVARTALTILPLAAAAIQAHAGVILLGSGGFNLSGSGFSLSPGGASSQALPAAGGITGIKFWGPSGGITITATSSGSNMCTSCYGLTAGFGVDPNNKVFTSDSLLTHFDFTVTDSNNLPIAWQVLTNLNTSGGFFSNSLAGQTLPGGNSVNTSFLITGLTGQTLNSWNLSLDVAFVGSYNSGSSITLTIPSNSVDVGGVSGAPEPATWSLLVAGGGLLALFRRKYSRVRNN